MTETDLVAAAWAEYETARAAYHAEVRRLRDEGVSKRKATKRARRSGHRMRLCRAYVWLHELGAVELRRREMPRAAQKTDVGGKGSG